MEKKLTLSIIIPMYNCADCVQRCLDSLYNQELMQDEYEIIVINDGSTDNGAAIIEQNIKEHSNIRLITQENQGPSQARNNGINHAKGEYICFVDSDDYIVPKAYSTLWNQVKEHSEVEIFTFQAQQIAERDIDIHKMADLSNVCLSAPLNGIEYIAKFNFRIESWSYFLKRSFLNDINLRQISGRSILEDGMFTIELFLNAKSIILTNLAPYRYVIRGNSIMHDRTPQKYLKFIDDWIFAIIYLVKLIERYKGKMGNNPACYQHLCSYKNIYELFLLIRVLKAKMPTPQIKEILNRLSDAGTYPFPRMLKRDYPSFKYTAIHFVLNKKYLFLFVCRVYKIFYH